MSDMPVVNEIHVTFDEGSQRAYGTLVPVQVYNEQLALVAERVVSLSEGASIPVLKPGLYLVRAELPTGEHISTTVPVSGEDVTATLVVPESSPREELAWAYAQQSVRRVSGPKDGPGLRLLAGNATVTNVYRIEGFRDQWHMVPAPVERIERRAVSLEDPRLIAQVQLVQSDRSGKPDDWYPLYVRLSLQLTPEAPEQTAFVAAPTGDRTMVVIIRNEANTLAGVPVAALVTGANPEAETLLAYLSQGAASAARRISQPVTSQAVNLLETEQSDPFAACIAGYYLLQAGQLERQEWMRNLADVFPAIPDGAIIYGASLLRSAQNRDDRDRARGYLLEAVKRGIPVYTMGLRLLFDLLRSLADDGEPGDSLESALQRVRYIAAYADWDAQTTTFAVPSGEEDPPIRLSE